MLAQLQAADFELRAKAALALSRYDDDAAIDALTAALRDRSVEVAVAAAGALAQSGARAARQTLFLVLSNMDGYYHALTRAAAVHGLGVHSRTTSARRSNTRFAITTPRSASQPSPR